MTQVKPFIIANAGTKPYWCLQNVRQGYGIPAKWDYALLDWQNNVQHKDQNYPSGCSVPVYFNWTGNVGGVTKNWGHIAVRLADGRIWTDGKYYANVSTLSTNYLRGGSYLGWGELVNNVRVVTQEVSMAGINDDVSRQIGWHFMGRNGYDGKPNALQSKQGDIYGKELSNAQMSAFFLSAEAREWRDSRLPKLYAERDALKASNANLNTQVTQMTKAVADVNTKLSQANAQLTSLAEVVNGQKIEINELVDENAKLRKQLENCGTAPDPDSVVITKDGLWGWFTNLFNKILRK